MTEFTPIPSLLGGLLIGLSAAVVFVFFGRIGHIRNCCSHAEF